MDNGQAWGMAGTWIRSLPKMSEFQKQHLSHPDNKGAVKLISKKATDLTRKMMLTKLKRSTPPDAVSMVTQWTKNESHACVLGLTELDNGILRRDGQNLTGEQSVCLTRFEYGKSKKRFADWPDAYAMQATYNMASISKHALCRLIQRNGTTQERMMGDVFTTLVVLENILNACTPQARIENETGEATDNTIAFPHKNGAFICRFISRLHPDDLKNKLAHISIRTYLDESKLSESMVRSCALWAHLLKEHTVKDFAAQSPLLKRLSPDGPRKEDVFATYEATLVEPRQRRPESCVSKTSESVS